MVGFLDSVLRRLGNYISQSRNERAAKRGRRLRGKALARQVMFEILEPRLYLSALPTPFVNFDIGSPTTAGSAIYVSASNQIQATGAGTGIAGTSDQFNYTAENWTGSGIVQADVGGLANTGSNAQAGVMIRDTSAAGSEFAAVMENLNNGTISFEYRSSTGGEVMASTMETATSPAWVQLSETQSGNTDSFTGLYSTDGVHWTTMNTAPVNITFSAATSLAGLAVTSGTPSSTVTVNVNSFSTAPSGVSDQDIGSPGIAGSASYNSSTGTWTVSGGGTDIWGSSDQFNFASQNFSGNGSIVAYVVSQTDTNAWAKAGVMFRDSNAAGSMFADVVVTPGNGVAFDWRNSTGGLSGGANVTGTGIIAPVWVKLERAGDSYSGFYSTNGTTWIQIGSSQTIAFSNTTNLAGLAVTALNNNAISTADISNVSLTAAPGYPTGLAAMAVSGSTVNLSWNTVAGATGYNIYRGTTAGGEIYSAPLNGSSPLTAASYSDTGLAAGSAYYYTVEAVNSTGSSPAGNEATDTTISSSQYNFVSTLEQNTFQYFWDNMNTSNGLIAARASSSGGSPSSYASIGVEGFGLTALCIADEHNWEPHSQIYNRVLTALEFFLNNAQSISVNGYYYHYLDMNTGQPSGPVLEVSSIDTALLMAGVLTVRDHFAGTYAATLATQLYDNVDWPWMLTSYNEPNGEQTLSMAWTPSGGFNHDSWYQFNEGPLIYLLGIGSPTHPLPASSWDAWTRTQLTTYAGYTFMNGTSSSPAPLFTHQYPQAWFNLNGLSDNTANYFTDSRYATLANQAMCINLANQFSDYGPNAWGISASLSPSGYYKTWGEPPPTTTGTNAIDGTLVPYAAAGSMPFAPQQTITDLMSMKQNFPSDYGQNYGFVDAFNPLTGTVATDSNGYDLRGLDQGITLIGAENFSTGFVQNTFMADPVAQRALALTGFHTMIATIPAAPVNLAATTAASSAVNLSWNTVIGATGYNVYRGTTSGGENYSAPINGSTPLTATSYSDTGLSADTAYYYTVEAVNSEGSSPVGNEVTATTLPFGWSDQDIGSPGSAGSAIYNSSTGTWAVNGGGSDIWNTSDQFNFASENWAGDGVIVADVTSQTNTNLWAKAGVMFRDSNAAGAMFADVVATPGNGVAFDWRNSTGGQCGGANVTGTGITAPVWVKLERAGDSYSGFYSTNGTTWIQIGTSQTIAFSNTTNLAGLAVTAADNTQISTAVISNVSILAAPTGLTAATISSSTVNLSWNAVTGATGYNIYRGTTSGGENYSAPINGSTPLTATSYSDTGLSADTAYYYTVEAVNSEGSSPVGNEVTATTLPFGWSDQDIGSPGSAGSAIYNSSTGTWAVNGGGSDIWNTSDQFNFASENWAGDGVIVADVTSQTNTNLWAKAGVMFRDSNAAGAMFADVVATPGNGVAFDWRNSTGGQCGGANVTGTGITAPVWVKLERAGDSYSGFYSTNGTTWIQIGTSQTIAFSNTTNLAGLAVTAADNTQISTAVISNVSILAAPTGLTAATISSSTVNLSWNAVTGATGYNIYRGTTSGGENYSAPLNGSTPLTAASYADTGLAAGTAYYYTVEAVNSTGSSPASGQTNATTYPTGWSDQDIGSPGIAGSAIYNSSTGTWAVSGGGSDIWNTSDQFNFASENWAGDGVIVADVTSQTNTNLWAKAGVMFRDSNAAGAMFADVVVTPGNGVAFQWRNSTGGQCGNAQVTGITTPVWVKLERAGDSYSGFYSTNGTTWIQIGTSQTIAFSNTTNLAGLAVTAADNTQISTADISNVSILAAPANLAATTASSGQINLSWNAVTGATGYNIYRGTTSGGENYSAPINGSTPLTATSYSDNGLAADTAYYYTVEAVNSAGSSPASNEATATTRAAIVDFAVNDTTSNGTFTTGTVGTAVIGASTDTWNIVNDLKGSATMSASSTLVDTTGAASGLSLSITAGGTWNYSLSSPDNTLLGSYMYYTNSAPGVFSTNGQAVISGLTAGASYNLYLYVAANNTEMRVIGSSTSSTYYLTNPNGASPYNTTFQQPANPTTASDVGTSSDYGNYVLVSGVKPDSSNNITIQWAGLSSVNGNYEGDFSGFQIQDPAAPINPTAPTNLAATTASSSAVNLSWNPVTGATGYNIYRGTTSGGENYSTPINGSTPLTAASYSDTGLAAGTAYYYTVEAVNSTGSSLASNEATATTTALPVAAVSSFTVNDGSAQRSMVTNVTVTFNQAVTLQTGAITLGLNGGGSIATTVTNPSGDGTTYLVTFSGTGTSYGSLNDGQYTLTVHAALVQNADGQAMAADSTFGFFRLFGDLDGDGVVNGYDYLLFRAAYGKSVGQSGYQAAFDYNGDGVINGLDYLEFRLRYGMTI